MDINAQRIKSQRNQRGWTQQHLADACGVSLRTIQRVERYGTASNDTAMSIASAFEIKTAEILRTHSEDEMLTQNHASSNLKLLPFFFSLLLGALLGSAITLLAV